MLLPLHDPPPSSHFWGVQLRAPPGGMSARSRAGSLDTMKLGACTKPDLEFSGFLVPRFPTSSCY